MSGLYPDTLYYIWLAARSQRGEGATSPSIPVRTKQYGKISLCVSLMEHSCDNKEKKRKLSMMKKKVIFIGNTCA